MRSSSVREMDLGRQYQGRSVPRRHSLGVPQQSDPPEKSVGYVVRRTFSISKSMASSSSSSRTFPSVCPLRTPRPPAPPCIATASPHLIASSPRLLWRRARSWPDPGSPASPTHTTTSDPAHRSRCEMFATKCSPELRLNFMPARRPPTTLAA